MCVRRESSSFNFRRRRFSVQSNLEKEAETTRAAIKRAQAVSAGEAAKVKELDSVTRLNHQAIDSGSRRKPQ
jgi:hypothetical protein